MRKGLEMTGKTIERIADRLTQGIRDMHGFNGRAFTATEIDAVRYFLTVRLSDLAGCESRSSAETFVGLVEKGLKMENEFEKSLSAVLMERASMSSANNLEALAIEFAKAWKAGLTEFNRSEPTRNKSTTKRVQK